MPIDPNSHRNLGTHEGVVAALRDLGRKVDSLEATRTVIGAGSIGWNHIGAAQITAGHIIAGSIDATHIQADAIQTVHLDAHVVTAEKLAATLTLASTIQTGTPPGRRVVMNEDGFYAYNELNQERLGFDIDSGSLRIAGVLRAIDPGSEMPITYLTSGELVTGAIFSLTPGGGYFETSPTNPRVQIDSAGWKSYNAGGELTTEITNTTATFQGATFRTGPAGAGRVQMDSTGFHIYGADGVTKNLTLTHTSGLDFAAATTATGETTRKLRWMSGSTSLAEIFKTTFSTEWGTNIRDFSSGTGSRRIVLAAEQAGRPANTAFAQIVLDGGAAAQNGRIELTPWPTGAFSGSAGMVLGLSGVSAYTSVIGQLNAGYSVPGLQAGGYTFAANGNAFFNGTVNAANSIHALSNSGGVYYGGDASWPHITGESGTAHLMFTAWNSRMRLKHAQGGWAQLDFMGNLTTPVGAVYGDPSSGFGFGLLGGDGGWGFRLNNAGSGRSCIGHAFYVNGVQRATHDDAGFVLWRDNATNSVGVMGRYLGVGETYGGYLEAHHPGMGRWLQVDCFAGDLPGFNATTDAYPVLKTNYTYIYANAASSGTYGYLANDGIWRSSSSIELKDTWAAPQGADLLTKIRSVRIPRWRFKEALAGSLPAAISPIHFSPIAEDFNLMFETGTVGAGAADPGYRGISALDVAGVALAGVQAAVEKGDADNAAILGALQRLEARLEALERRPT